MFLFFNSAYAFQHTFAFKRVLPPRNLTYTSLNPTYSKWIAITNNTPSYSGAAVTSWGISPALPTGLSFSTTTGVISGTATDNYSGSHVVTAANSGGSATVTLNITVVPSGYTWVGNAAPDTSWSTGANWYGGVAPSANTHVVYFDTECGSNCNATISSAVTMRSLNLKTGYTGTITQSAGVGNTLNLGTNSGSTLGGIVVESGTFIGGNANIRADFISITGGSFTSTSAELRIGFNAASGSGTGSGILYTAPGVFTHNSGSMYLDFQTSGAGGRTCGTLTLDQIMTLNNLSIDCHDTNSDANYNSSVLAIAGTSRTFQVLNELDFVDGFTQTGTIYFQGTNVDFLCDSDTAPNICSGSPGQTFSGSGNSGTNLIFNGSSPQTYTFQNGASGPSFEIDNALGVGSSGTGWFSMVSLRVVNGTFTAPNADLRFMHRMDIHHQNNSIGFAVETFGAFAHNGGTVTLSGNSQSYSDSRTFFVFTLTSAAITFNNLILDQTCTQGATGRDLRNTTIPAGATVTILNDYTVKNGRMTKVGGGANPLFTIRGDYRRECANLVTHNCADQDTSIDKLFDTAGTVIYNAAPSDAECASCVYTFNPGAGNTVTIDGLMNLSDATAQMVVTSGTLNIASGGVRLGSSLTNNSAITCAAGKFIHHDGALLGTPGGGNDTNCYRTTPVDPSLDAMAWADFTGSSTSQTFSGVDFATTLQISVTNTIGTPTLRFRYDGGSNGAYTTVNVGTPVNQRVMNGHFLDFTATGTSGDSGEFTIRNVTDGNVIIDTVTATVP